MTLKWRQSILKHPFICKYIFNGDVLNKLHILAQLDKDQLLAFIRGAFCTNKTCKCAKEMVFNTTNKYTVF